MAISYNGLWKILIDNGMKKGDLKRRTGISSGTIAKMTNGEVKKRHFKLDDMVGMEILKYLYYRILRIWLSMIHQ